MLKISKEIKYIVLSGLFIFGLLLIARISMFTLYYPEQALLSDVFYAFYLGMKFDARMVAWILLPLVIFFQTRWTSLVTVPWARLISRYYLQLAGFFYVLVAIVDLEFYEYHRQRLSAMVTSFLDDIGTSIGAAYESYPIFLYSLILFAVIAGQHKYMSWLISWLTNSEFSDSKRRIYRIVRQTVFVFLTLFVIYGNFSIYGLRWSNAFFTQNSNVSNLVFNPIHNLFDTAKLSQNNYKLNKVKEYYPLIADYLGFTPDPDKLTYLRHYSQKADFKPRNVVIIVMESFSYSRTRYGQNYPTLSPTRNFDSIAKDSLLYSNHYVPVRGTSWSLWALVTGIPDLNPGTRSSHNPFIIDQRVIMNEFKGYDRYFFYSDNASWGNVRGFLSKNVDGIKFYESDDFEGKRISTWGVSDIRVFDKANEVFESNKKPFISIILTSGNHMPFTVPTDPKDLDGFEWVNLPQEELESLGFYSNQEFNSLRYLDHSLGHYFKIAKNKEYFNNTLFVIMGDHGHVDRRKSFSGFRGSDELYQFHVPLAFYSPGFIKPEIDNTIVNEMDVFPTIAGLVGIEYNNYTLGRDLTRKRSNKNYALTRSFSGRYGLVSDRFYLLTRRSAKPQLFMPFSSDHTKNHAKEFPSIVEKLSNYVEAFVETTLYMLENNGRSRPY